MPNHPSPSSSCESATTALSRLWYTRTSPSTLPAAKVRTPRTSLSRLSADDSKTFLYLAYGSNLSAETFKGARGIQPLSAINVHVPSLDLTFDLAGIPYIEPCFANTRYRKPASADDYHKDRWQKGLVGVVYEVTPEDYRTIIATEGGGASYQDVVVECFVVPDGTKVVDSDPTAASFKAHTLLSPATSKNGRIQRPDPSYAQASARYLKLITDGGEEHGLPDDYMAYLYNLRPYTITTARQRIGLGLIVAVFMPIGLALIGLGRVLADKNGKIPAWLAKFMGLFFGLVWGVYDGFMKKPFGDGERTMDGGKDDEERGICRLRWCEKSVRLEGEEGSLR